MNIAQEGIDDIFRNANHETIEMSLVTPDAFLSTYTNRKFDFKSLVDQMKLVCGDYEDELQRATPSYSVDFCGKVLYQIGPQSRNKDKIGTTRDFIWTLKFPEQKKYPIADDQSPDAKVTHVINICTFRVNQPVTDQPKAIANSSGCYKLVLTLKQANMLACHKLNFIIDCLRDDEVILTPLAGAVFSANKLRELCCLYNTIERPPVDIDVKTMLKILNCSAQTGGSSLADSDPNLAYAIAFKVTSNITDEKVKASILKKLEKQYIAIDKPPVAEKVICYLDMIITGSNLKGVIEKYMANPDAPENLTLMAKVRSMRQACASVVLKSGIINTNVPPIQGQMQLTTSHQTASSSGGQAGSNASPGVNASTGATSKQGGGTGN